MFPQSYATQKKSEAAGSTHRHKEELGCQIAGHRLRYVPEIAFPYNAKQANALPSRANAFETLYFAAR